MRRYTLFALFFAAVAGAIASLQFGAAGQGKQNSSEKSGDFSHDEWAVIKTLSPLPTLPAGTMSELSWHRAHGELGFRVVSARSPGEIYSLDPKTGAANFSFWFRARQDSSVNAMTPVVDDDLVFISSAYFKTGSVLRALKSPSHPRIIPRSRWNAAC